MAAGKEALQNLLKDIDQVQTWWYRTRQTLIEQGFIAEDRAWEPDWAPWREKEAIWARIDEIDARNKPGGTA